MKFRPTFITQFFVFLIPLFFLTLTRDFIDFNKNELLVLLSLLSVILFALKSILAKKITIKFSRVHAAALSLAFTYILSLIIITPNKVEALLQPGGISTILALTLLLFTIPQLTPLKSAKTILIPLLLSGTLLSLFTILNMIGLLTSLPIPEALKNPSITPAGTLLTATLFLGIVSITAAKEIIMSKKQGVRSLIFFGTTFLIALAGTVTSTFRLSQDTMRPFFLPTATSWTIAAENIKIPKQALLGVGPGNYTNAFTIGKTANLNNSDIWNVRFNSGSNYLLHVFTELGVIGLFSLLSLIFFVIKHKHRSLGAITTLIVLTILPHNMLLLILLYLFLIVMVSKHSDEYAIPGNLGNADSLSHALGLENSSMSNLSFIPIVTAIILIAGASAGIYYQSVTYRAEMYITKGLLSATTTNNQETYDFQRKAIELNPYHSDYRVIFSRTNLALANLLSQKEEPTDEDIQTVTQLVIQSVNNGKIAIQLKPSASTWTNLASIYRNLINSAQGAADWTIQSYNQAIAFDRMNPTLRLNLGQVYYSLELYEPAIRQFELAAQLKPDYANAWYNLANAARQMGNIQVARIGYNQVLALISPETPDYQTALAELNALPDTIPQDQVNLEELQSPETAPEEEITTDVELNQEESAPDLTFPDEATSSAESQNETPDSASATISPNTTPTNTPAPSPIN